MTEPTAHALQKRRILKGGPRINKRKEFGRADKARGCALLGRSDVSVPWP